MAEDASKKPGLLKRLWGSWATRSLAVGAVATAIDLAVGLSLLSIGVSTLVSARVGVAIGSTFTFAANRYFAFREHNPNVTTRSLLFILTMSAVVTMASAWAAGFIPDSFSIGWLFAVAVLAVTMPAQIHWLRHTDPDLKGQATRFVTSTLISMYIHGLLVEWLRDKMGVPFAISKMAADLVVFTFVQLLLLRYLVFKKKPATGEPPATEAPAADATSTAPPNA
ncbi:MAG: GtrA family protein [Myxococcota bacterium]